MVIEVAGMEVVTLISRGSAKRINLKEGDEASAVIKATEVMVEK
jgi:molybdopterin-binding protein